MRLNPISIRWLVPLLVVLPILLIIGGLCVPAVFMARHIAEDLGSSLMDSTSDSIHDQVQDYLAQAVQASNLYTWRIKEGTLKVGTDLQHWEPYMLDDLRSTPDIASICFGDQNGDSTWLLRGPGRLELGHSDGSRDCYAIEFPMDEAGHKGSTPLREYRYDPRVRPWYLAALQSPVPIWTPVYSWFGEKGAAATTGTGFTRTIRDAQDNVVGVLVIDVTLGSLSEFLHRSRLTAQRGQIFIVDDQDKIVAAAQGAVVAPDGSRLAISAATNVGARAVAPLLASYRARPVTSAEPILATINLEGEAARARISPLTLFNGLRWRVITMLPEAAFMEEAIVTQRRVAAFSLLAAILGIVLGMRVAGYITHPLLQITGFVRRVGRGDYDARLDLRAARELRVLSSELNEMGAGLKQRMALSQALAVAMEVQQSLLPEADPVHETLDVVGRSHFCDETGGDYYDLIDLAPRRPEAMLIAVGDVMGHGIGAALLMASARAALRAHAPQESNPGVLLNHVNAVLATNARHNRFMTMLLARVSGEGAVTWASAGHDPPLVYLPDTDTFEELEGGEIPLGLYLDVEYSQFEHKSLPRGAVLLIGTDGIWEMHNAANEMYGKERMREVLRAHHAGPAAQIAAALEADLANFRGQRQPVDDVTFVIVKIGCKSARQEPAGSPGAVSQTEKDDKSYRAAEAAAVPRSEA